MPINAEGRERAPGGGEAGRAGVAFEHIKVGDLYPMSFHN